MSRAVAIAVAAIAGCLAQAALAQDSLKVAIGQINNWENQPPTLGQDVGIFKKYNLTLENFGTAGAGETIQAVISGSADIGGGVGVGGVLRAFSKGAPVRIILPSYTGTNDLYWYVKADSPIKSLKDATDKNTVAYSTNGSSSNNIVIAFVEELGLKAKPTATGGLPGTLTSVMSGQIDIGWGAPPFGVKEINEGKIRVIARGSDIPSLRGQTVRVIIANADALAKKHDAMMRFVKGFREAVNWMYDDPKAITMYAKKINTDEAIIKQSITEYQTRAALQTDEMKDFDGAMKDAVKLKFLDKPLTPEQVKEFRGYSATLKTGTREGGMRRRDFIIGVAGAVAIWPRAVRAQSKRLIGVLMPEAEDDGEAQARLETFRSTLRDLGWDERANLQMEVRWGGGDASTMQSQAAELVDLRCEVFFVVTVAEARALRLAHRNIPMVFVAVADPVGQKLVQSLDAPGGNTTGITTFEFSQATKWLEIVKALGPRVDRVGVIFNPATAPASGAYLGLVESAAPSFGMKAAAMPVADAAALERSINLFASEANRGLIVLPDTFTTAHRQLIVERATWHHLPAVYPARSFAVSGGVVSYGVNMTTQFQEAAALVDRILKGEKAGDIAVQPPSKFELVVNRKAASAEGLEIPQSLLERADEKLD